MDNSSVFDKLRSVRRQRKFIKNIDNKKARKGTKTTTFSGFDSLTPNDSHFINNPINSNNDVLSGYETLVNVRNELLHEDAKFHNEYSDFQKYYNKLVVEDRKRQKKKYLSKIEIEEMKQEAILVEEAIFIRHQAAMMIQANYRGYIVRKYLLIALNKKLAARKILYAMRRYINKKHYRNQVLYNLKVSFSATKIQYFFKNIMQRMLWTQALQVRNEVIEALVLGYKTRKILCIENMIELRKKILRKKFELEDIKNRDDNMYYIGQIEELNYEVSSLTFLYNEYFNKYFIKGWTFYKTNKRLFASDNNSNTPNSFKIHKSRRNNYNTNHKDNGYIDMYNKSNNFDNLHKTSPMQRTLYNESSNFSRSNSPPIEQHDKNFDSSGLTKYIRRNNPQESNYRRHDVNMENERNYSAYNEDEMFLNKSSNRYNDRRYDRGQYLSNENTDRSQMNDLKHSQLKDSYYSNQNSSPTALKLSNPDERPIRPMKASDIYNSNLKQSQDNSPINIYKEDRPIKPMKDTKLFDTVTDPNKHKYLQEADKNNEQNYNETYPNDDQYFDETYPNNDQYINETSVDQDRPIKPMKNLNIYSEDINENEFAQEQNQIINEDQQNENKPITKKHKNNIKSGDKKKNELFKKRARYDPRKAIQEENERKKNAQKDSEESEASIQKPNSRSNSRKFVNHKPVNNDYSINDTERQEPESNMDNTEYNINEDDYEKPKKKFSFLKRQTKKIEFQKLNWKKIRPRVDCWTKEDQYSVKMSNTHYAFEAHDENLRQSIDPTRKNTALESPIPSPSHKHKKGNIIQNRLSKNFAGKIGSAAIMGGPINTKPYQSQYNSLAESYVSVEEHKSHSNSPFKIVGSKNLRKRSKLSPEVKNTVNKDESLKNSSTNYFSFENTMQEKKQFALNQVVTILNGTYKDKLAKTLLMKPMVKKESIIPRMNINSRLVKEYQRDIFSEMVKQLDSDYELLIGI